MDADLLTDMATFAAVVDNNGFSAAADALRTSKSNVSRRVASLETRLNVTLMHRTTRKLTLTESGRLYYEHCARLVNDAKDADDAIRLMHSVPSGRLNLSVPETLGRAFILPQLPEFLKLYPKIDLNLTITSRKVDLIEDCCDVAVRKGAADDDGLALTPLGSSTQLLYASPDYLATAGPVKTPSDLSNHKIMTSLITHGPTDLTLWRDTDRVDVRVTPRLSVRDHDALLDMTCAGLGISLLPAWMAGPQVRQGKLVRVLPKYEGPSVNLSIVYLPHRGMTPNLRAIVDFLTEKFAQNRPWDKAPHELIVPDRVSSDLLPPLVIAKKRTG